jgi:arginyl-tRNA synthetase
MSFDPSLPTVRDRIRLAVGDTSNDPETEFFGDATYNVIIAEETNWKRAGARIAEAILADLKQGVKSYSLQGVFSVTLLDPDHLSALAARWYGEADRKEASASNGRVVTVVSDYQTGDDDVGRLAW